MLQAQAVEQNQGAEQMNDESAVVNEYTVERVYMGEQPIKDLLKEILIGRSTTNVRNLR